MNFSYEQGSKYKCHVVQNCQTGVLECVQEGFLTLMRFVRSSGRMYSCFSYDICHIQYFKQDNLYINIQMKAQESLYQNYVDIWVDFLCSSK